MKFKYLSKENLSNLPPITGIYCFKAKNKFLYIGKAINLKNRVKNHSNNKNNKLWVETEQIGYLLCPSEVEALILEAKLIKKHQPKYNVIWRDDKNYFFATLTKEKFPRIFIGHQVNNNKAEIIGPFIDGKALKETLKILRKVFPYRTCRFLPKKPCLWHQLQRCYAPCLLKKDSEQQIKIWQNKANREKKLLIKILQGKKQQVLKDLKKEMEKSSALQNFEKAMEVRNQITALEKIFAHSKIFQFTPEIDLSQKSKQNLKALKKVLKIKKDILRVEAYDISNIQGKEATGSMITFTNGRPDKNFYRRFKIKLEAKPNDTAMLKEILTRRLKHSEWKKPDLILVDGGQAQLNAAIKTLKEHKISIKVIALAKKKNELYLEKIKKPILLKSFPTEIFNLVLQMRDEAHRFAISYHRKLRKRVLIE